MSVRECEYVCASGSVCAGVSANPRVKVSVGVGVSASV